MRIALILGTGAVGGAQVSVSHMAKSFSQSGHEVLVIFLTHGGPVRDAIAVSGLDTVVCSGSGASSANPGSRTLRRPRILGSLAMQLSRFQPDVVHAMLPGAIAYGLALARAVVPSAARVAGLRGHALNDSGTIRTDSQQLRHRGLQPTLMLHQLKSAHAVTAISRSVADSFSNLCGIPRSRIEVIYNGVSPSVHAHSLTAEPPIGLHVANFLPVKGHRELLDTFRRVKWPTSLELLGQDSKLRCVLRTEYESPVVPSEQGGSGNRIRFLDPSTDARSRMSSVQYGLLPSLNEGLSMALLEMMSAGLPTVASRVGGIPELVTDGREGILVDPGDKWGLLDAITRTVKNPQMRVEMGGNARERSLMFTWERSAERHLELYALVRSR